MGRRDTQPDGNVIISRAKLLRIKPLHSRCRERDSIGWVKNGGSRSLMFNLTDLNNCQSGDRAEQVCVRATTSATSRYDKIPSWTGPGRPSRQFKKVGSTGRINAGSCVWQSRLGSRPLVGVFAFPFSETMPRRTLLQHALLGVGCICCFDTRFLLSRHSHSLGLSVDLRSLAGIHGGNVGLE